MSYPNYLIIHKKEWDRIKRVDKSSNEYEEREEYFKSLIEQSQELIKKWSDSVQGHINKLENQKLIKYAKDIQTVKDFHSRKELHNYKDVIKNAKELIFQDSCYGRQLLSALYESKALEERDAQLKFKLQLKEISEDQKNNEPTATSLPIGNDTESEELQRKLTQRQIEVEITQINKTLCEIKYKENNEKREKEKQQKLENKKLVKEIINKEIELESEILEREKEDIEKYVKQNKEIKKARAVASQKEDLIREVWRKYDENIKCRQKSVFNKIHRESCNGTRSQNAYEIIEQINYEKDKKYNDFIETGLKRHVKRLNEQEQQEIESKTIERNKRKLLDQDNKMLMDFKRQIDFNNDSNCREQNLHVQGIPVNKKTSKSAKRAVTPSFLAPRNSLLKNLKIRENDTSSKKVVNAAHAQFAGHASGTLRECRYKNMAWKVINDYRRINCIEEQNLPISD